MEQQLKDANIETQSHEYKKTKKLTFTFNGSIYSIILNKDKNIFNKLTISNFQTGQSSEPRPTEIKKEDEIINIISTLISTLTNNMSIQ